VSRAQARARPGGVESAGRTPSVDGTFASRATQDLFGWALRHWAGGATDPEVLERDDGFCDTALGHELYLADFRRWPTSEKEAMRFVRGRVMDVGCGAGRVALHLQRSGYHVTAVDSSPVAVSTARRSGVRRSRCLPVESLAPHLGDVDTVVLFGNNLGIFGTLARTRRLLAAWARDMPAGARLLAQSTNPYGGGAPCLTRSYYRANRRRGRPGGQLRLRLHHRGRVGPWFDWLFLSRRELGALVAGTGWRTVAVLGRGPVEPYVALLEKDRPRLAGAYRSGE